MAAIIKKAGVEEEAPQVHRIRITLTSKNVKNLEKVGQIVSTLSLILRYWFCV